MLENGTQAIQRALAVLNCFAHGVDSLSLTEISRLVEIPYSTASRIVGILEQESFLIRDKHSKRYTLGRRIYGLGYCAKQNDSLLKVTHPYLEKLRDDYGKTACLYVLRVIEAVRGAGRARRRLIGLAVEESGGGAPRRPRLPMRLVRLAMATIPSMSKSFSIPLGIIPDNHSEKIPTPFSIQSIGYCPSEKVASNIR